jgi:hypothetical protein
MHPFYALYPVAVGLAPVDRDVSSLVSQLLVMAEQAGRQQSTYVQVQACQVRTIVIRRVSAYQKDTLAHFNVEAVFTKRRKGEKHTPRKLDGRCQHVRDDERSKKLQHTLV